ncbi:MAG TPA: enolase C-terminal domain-like protein [Bryobacteraceae bacterium]|nr:enolase C-terminal domain-like protein [Bryobacteraceae bacterium]
MSRRTFLAGAAAAGPALVAGARPTDIRIEHIEHAYEEYRYRAPYKFGGVAVDRVTLLNVRCVVRTAAGHEAAGFGSMPMGNVWSFPSRFLTYDQTLAAMKALAERISAVTAVYREYGHPLDLNAALEPGYLHAAQQVTAAQKLAEPIPKLCTLVTASPFDAAIHDAFGKVHGRSTWLTYGPDLLPGDLSRYLGSEYTGRRLSDYLLARPVAMLPLYHSVGALDPLTEADVREPLHDGLPQTLPQWIAYNGIDHIKIKLNGDDLVWDVDRVAGIHRVAAEAQARRNGRECVYSLDFNERCRNVEYLLEFIHRLKETSPDAFRRIQYIEQPTARDLNASRHNLMTKASKLVPVVIDESLTGLDALMLAQEMGYTGAALKACKGQSQAVLMAAAGQIHKMFLCVQDLTCPGASLIHSVGLAAHVPGVAGIEANARQFVPAANRGWETHFPGIFAIRDGLIRTTELSGNGLGAVP